MSLSLPRKNSQNGTVGLDVDGRYVAAVRAQRGQVAMAASSDLPDGLVVEGEVVDASGLSSALKSFASSAGLPRNVRLGVANQQIVVRLMELPPIEDATPCLFYRPLSTTWDGADAVDTLGDEIRLSLDYYMAQPDAVPAGELVLSGPHSQEEALVQGLSVALGLETIVAPPLGSLDASALGADEDPRRYTVAAGLALGAAA